MSHSKNPFVRGYDGLSVQRLLAISYDDDCPLSYLPLHVSQSHLPDSQVERHACVFCDDFALITEGHELVRACLHRNRPGRYQLQAAIAAVPDLEIVRIDPNLADDPNDPTVAPRERGAAVMDAAVAAVEQAAIQASCETRRLVGQQAAAFTAAALPLTRPV